MDRNGTQSDVKGLAEPPPACVMAPVGAGVANGRPP